MSDRKRPRNIPRRGPATNLRPAGTHKQDDRHAIYCSNCGADDHVWLQCPALPREVEAQYFSRKAYA